MVRPLQNPFTTVADLFLYYTAVILLNEFEKAHQNVAMILLQIFDEGSITDSQGQLPSRSLHPVH